MIWANFDGSMLSKHIHPKSCPRWTFTFNTRLLLFRSYSSSSLVASLVCINKEQAFSASVPRTSFALVPLLACPRPEQKNKTHVTVLEQWYWDTTDSRFLLPPRCVFIDKELRVPCDFRVAWLHVIITEINMLTCVRVLKGLGYELLSDHDLGIGT